MGKKLIWLSLLTLLTCTVLVSAHGQKNKQTNAYHSGFNHGYSQGFDQGKNDLSNNTGFNGNRDFQNTQIGYNKAYGSRSEFKKGFQSGFKSGYQDGFSGKEKQQALSDVDVLPSSGEIPPPAEMARAEAQTGTTVFRSGWDTGYKNGYKDGQADHDKGAKLDADDAPGYKGYRSTYESSMGKRSRYKKAYLEGFNQGYQDGYSGLVSRLIQSPSQEQIPAASMKEEIPSHATPSPAQPSTAMQEQPVQQSNDSTEPTENQTAQTQPQPEALPKTASGLPLLALFGLAGIFSSLLLRALRNCMI
jgi:hypothetical protein